MILPVCLGIASVRCTVECSGKVMKQAPFCIHMYLSFTLGLFVFASAGFALM